MYRQIPNALPRFQKNADYFKGITFLKAISLSLGSGVAFYDLDGDGVKNPITYNHEKFVYWRNTGSRQSPQWKADSSILPAVPLQYLYYKPPYAAIKPSLGDLDGDNDADLITGQGFFDNRHDLTYFENVSTNSNPQWRRDTTVVEHFRNGYDWWAPRIIDAEGDGKAELALAMQSEGQSSI